MGLQENSGISAKRTFITIRAEILKCLLPGHRTINHISNETGINWKTVENHLTYLVGKGLAREVFSSSYVRIFEITAFGKDYLRRGKMLNPRDLGAGKIYLNRGEIK